MKRIVSNILVGFALVGALSSCGQKKVVVSQLDGRWTLTALQGEAIEMNNTPFFEFNLNENRVSGKAGCNNFNSQIKLDESDASAIRFTMPATTMMACPDMEKESKVLRAFVTVAYVRGGANTNEVNLVDEAGMTVFSLVRE
jgi:Heat shock protein